MNILYHHRTRAEGVEGVHIRGTVEALRQLGHQVIVVSPLGNSLEEQRVRDARCSVPRRLYNFVSESFPQVGFELMEIAYNLPAYCGIWNVIQREKIDFIYERYALYGASGVKLARTLGIPIVLEVNIVSDLDDVRSVKMRSLALKFENSILNSANAIVTVSNFLKRHMISRGIDGQKIWVIPNAVDPNELHIGNGTAVRHKYNIEDSFIIGFVGRLVPWYNLEALIESVSEIVDSGRDKLHLLLVGEGAMRPELSELIRRHNLSRYVTMTGWVEHSRIFDYISAMDVTLLPNSNLWGSPMKIFEYMAMGKPVVAPAYDPIKEVITSGRNGILFKPGDYSELRQAVLALMDDGNLRRVISGNARSTVVENHTWVKNAEKVIDIYESLKDNS
jgi:glycosyltransferase involved in cell wall biosynthesis